LGHVTCMRNTTDAYKILVGNPKGKRSRENLDIDVKVILDWIIWK